MLFTENNEILSWESQHKKQKKYNYSLMQHSSGANFSIFQRNDIMSRWHFKKNSIIND